MKAGTYKLSFDTEDYWKRRGQESFYPYVEVRASAARTVTCPARGQAVGRLRVTQPLGTEVPPSPVPLTGPHLTAPPPTAAPQSPGIGLRLWPASRSLGAGLLEATWPRARPAACSPRPGHFHHRQRDPWVPRPATAEPLVLHHVPRELTASGLWAPTPSPWPRATPAPRRGLRAPRRASGPTCGGPGSRLPAAAVTWASIKSPLASTRLPQSLCRARRVLPGPRREGWGTGSWGGASPTARGQDTGPTWKAFIC